MEVLLLDSLEMRNGVRVYNRWWTVKSEVTGCVVGYREVGFGIGGGEL